MGIPDEVPAQSAELRLQESFFPLCSGRLKCLQRGIHLHARATHILKVPAPAEDLVQVTERALEEGEGKSDWKTGGRAHSRSPSSTTVAETAPTNAPHAKPRSLPSL